MRTHLAIKRCSIHLAAASGAPFGSFCGAFADVLANPTMSHNMNKYFVDQRIANQENAIERRGQTSKTKPQNRRPHPATEQNSDPQNEHRYFS
jgi:hypothetical protein